MTARGSWIERRDRYRARAAIWADLQLAAFSWHLGGGRLRASREYQAAVADHKWCFIVGCNNSGTSLLQGILEKSGQVSTFPHEGQRYTNALPPARKRGHERVWTEYLEELRLDENDSLHPAPRLVHDWMRKLAHPVRETIVEKTTANAVRMRWLQEAFPRSYFIGLVRNGFAVTEGICRKGRKSVERGARHWNRVNELMLRDAGSVERFLLVKYEDLVTKPGAAAARLAEFLALDAERVALATAGKYDFCTLSGGGSQSISNMNLRSISRLSASDLDTIRRFAGPMLERLDYSSDLEPGGETSDGREAANVV